MESDYDDVIAPSEFFGTDEKGDAPFGDLRGFGPADRAPIYQGDYHEYEGGDWTEMKVRPQMLASNDIYAETGMAHPAPKKPQSHHPLHPGLNAKALTAAQVGPACSRGIGGVLCRGGEHHHAETPRSRKLAASIAAQAWRLWSRRLLRCLASMALPSNPACILWIESPLPCCLVFLIVSASLPVRGQAWQRPERAPLHEDASASFPAGCWV